MAEKRGAITARESRAAKKKERKSMTSKLTILSIDTEAAGRDVRHLQETVLLLEQLRQLLENIGSRDLADLAAHAAGELQEAVRCIRESARKYENVELEPELTRPGEGSGAVWLAAAAAKLLAQVPTHEEWACREQTAIDRHIADGRRLVRGLTERLGSLPGSR